MSSSKKCCGVKNKNDGSVTLDLEQNVLCLDAAHNSPFPMNALYATAVYRSGQPRTRQHTNLDLNNGRGRWKLDKNRRDKGDLGRRPRMRGAAAKIIDKVGVIASHRTARVFRNIQIECCAITNENTRLAVNASEIY
ncbi:hypothetical protein ACJJTC_001126 [Scirpophaga incertulas]